MKTAIVSLILVSNFLISLIPACAISTQTNISDIEKLSNNIVRNELALLKLENRFLLEQESYDKFKPWREFVYNSGAAGTIHSGIILQTINGWRGFKNPRKISRKIGKAGGSLLVTGGCITIGGAFIETALDFIRDKKLKQRGMDTKSVLNNFVRLRKEISSLLSKREEMVADASLTDRQKNLLAAEGAVLNDINELCATTFVDSFIKTKHALWQRETAKILAVESAANSSFLGSLNSLLAFTDHHPHQIGIAGIGFTLGGASVMMTPFILKAAGACGARRARQQIDNKLGKIQINNLNKLRADIQQLTAMASTAGPSELEVLTALNTRQSIYEAHQLLLFDEPFLSGEERKKEAAQFKERVIFSTLIGGSNLARGILSLNSGYRYYDSPKKFDELNAIASTTYTAGTGIWIMDLLQQRTRAELKARKLRLAKTTPAEKLQARLDAIDNLDNAIRVY